MFEVLYITATNSSIMHPRNKYFNNPADFGKLGEKYSKFRKYLVRTSSGYTINFKDPKALRELTVCLLHHDFGLTVELPLDRLIPTITLRLNYIHWIEDLLQMLPKNDQTQITGIDIGTGSSCVYPLLGAKINNWKFCATEVDEISYRFAIENVKKNHFEETIRVHLATPDVILVDLLKEGEQYDFTMCNPPFFADKSETVGSSRTGDRPRPSSVCTGSESETVTSGGEVAFVGRMIEDSLRLGSRVKWFTSMLGKKSSLASVLTKLRQNKISNIITTEFCQGKTMRWGVAWTFLSDVPTQDTPKKRRKNKPLEFTFSSTSVCSKEALSGIMNINQYINKISKRFKEMLNNLQVQVLSESSSDEKKMKLSRLHCCATHNTWANQRRKRREAAGKLKTSKQLSTKGTSEDEQSKNPPRTSEISLEELVTSDQDTVSKVSTGNKRRHSSSPDITKRKFLKSDDTEESKQVLIEFALSLGTKCNDLVEDNVLPEMFLQMEWIDGQDRNCMYQLFQYFKNRFSS
ncbi:RNA N6-adenosine-methyltransferase mettl16-like [Dendronephthya gigantea]|uniref:RNA N6-adenosine-methyltransferase mettl16-like n=1 Tax=Dendronephthya gigantea TaxID=151771 RepID=UPI00106AA9C6|nr:RNA N6-adenosine-methyltransferase mettl16-like [Dendronephthya gigantea]